MLDKWKGKQEVKRRIHWERKQLLKAVQLAKTQWQYGRLIQDNSYRKYHVLQLLERRYMYLYRVAKQRKLHALE